MSNKTLSKPALLGCLRRPQDAILKHELPIQTAVPSKWQNRSKRQGTCTQNRGSIGIWLNTFALHLLWTFRNVMKFSRVHHTNLSPRQHSKQSRYLLLPSPVIRGKALNWHTLTLLAMRSKNQQKQKATSLEMLCRNLRT